MRHGGDGAGAAAGPGRAPRRHPAALADQSDIVLGSLPTPEAVQAVGLGPQGLLHGQRARRFIDLSTTGPRIARRWPAPSPRRAASPSTRR
ncbi:hypothetical protein [Teichococcus aestuarii]|uniref:hypothetical protein n=1 Tax=Teichococcus aestuarii TaxID=568898 RepID=UPI00361D9C37